MERSVDAQGLEEAGRQPERLAEAALAGPAAAAGHHVGAAAVVAVGPGGEDALQRRVENGDLRA